MATLQGNHCANQHPALVATTHHYYGEVTTPLTHKESNIVNFNTEEYSLVPMLFAEAMHTKQCL